MKKTITILALALFVAAAYAQTPGNTSSVTTKQVVSNVVLDANEDPEDFQSVADLARKYDMAAYAARTRMHHKQIWKRRGFLSLGYLTSGELVPKSNPYEGINAPLTATPDFGLNAEIATGFMLANKGEQAWGKNCWANLFLDIIPINLQYVKYSATTGEGGMAYDETVKNGHDTPLYWNLPKTTLDYSCMIGPRLAFAPFTWVKRPEWKWTHETHLSLYGHVGYQAGVVNFEEDKSIAVGQRLPNFKKTAAFNHGPVVKYGVALDIAHGWGLGMEQRMALPAYRAMDTEIFGDDILTFDTKTTRVYLYYRFTTSSRLGKVLNR